MDSNPVKVIDKLLILNIFKHYYNIQAAKADIKDVGLASKVVDNIPVMVVQKLNSSVNIQLTYFQAYKFAAMAKKLVSRKDQEDHSRKDYLVQIEDRIVGNSANLGNGGSELTPWEVQRKKSVPKLNETVQLSLFNRFSFWEDEDKSDVDDGSDDEDDRVDKDGSDNLPCSPKVVDNNWKVVECQSKRQKVISKKNRKHYESITKHNSGQVCQNLTEDDIKCIKNNSEIQIEEVPMGEYVHATTSSKIKCRKCGYKKNCIKPNSCQAEDKCCSFCRKLNHFPQSLNCKKNRALNQKKKKENLTRYGCQTLREFLVSKAFQLTSYNIPYEDLSKIHKHKCTVQKSQQPKCDSKRMQMDKRTVEKINLKIKYLEGKVQFEKEMETLTKGTQFFLGAYILFNLPLFLLDNVNRSPNYNNISENDIRIEKDVELSNEIREFLEISNNTTYCLENYVGAKFDLEEPMEPGLADCFGTGRKFDTKYEKETDMRKQRLETYSSKFWQQMDHLRFQGLKENLRRSPQSCEVNNPNSSSTPLEMCDFSPIPQTDAVSFEDLSFSASSPSKSPFDWNFYSQVEFDLNCSNGLDKSNSFNIVQLDGLHDEPFNGLAGINCDNQFISSIITVFRSFEGIWKDFDDHPLCMRAKKAGLRCLFCQVRSLSLRLNRAKIKVNLKPVEILSQQDQLPNIELLDYNFPKYFKKILEKMELYEKKVYSANFEKSLQCRNCSENVHVCLHGSVKDISKLTSPSVETIMTKIVDDAAEKHNLNCRNASLKLTGLEKFIIMTFDLPNKIKVPSEICYKERNFIFISQVFQHEDKTLKSAFKYQNDVYSSIDMKPPEKINSIFEENVLLVVYKLKSEKDEIWQIDDSPITYRQSSLANMNQRLNKFVEPEKYEKRRCDKTETDKKRDETAKRKDAHKLIDKKRDDTPKRKAEHIEIDNTRNKRTKRLIANSEVDKKRDQTPKRKEDHQDIDKKRDQTPKRKEGHRNINKKRNQTPKRKEAQQDIDKKRDQTPKRKEGHRNINKKRNQTPKRKEAQQNIDKKRDQTPKRKEEHRKIEKKRRATKKRKDYKKDYNTKVILKSIHTDTGFNNVCTCCAEYKSKNLCVKVTVLSESQQNKYISSFIGSKDGKVYICKTCRSQIALDRKPKKSGRIMTQNFPMFLKNHLKKNINYVTILNKRKIRTENITEADIDETLQLNKLEAHLLKLVIPFIRIAHCPRGRYIKVKGSVILISSNISHSMSKILPRNQNLLPVCLKRKLEYTGNYIEEVIDRMKVEIYFNFLKRFNPLYNESKFQDDQIDKYEDECDSISKRFKEALDKIPINPEKEKRTESGSDSESESGNESSEEDLDNNFNTYDNTEKERKSDAANFFRDQTTVFCNKYEEDVNVPTVANRFANIIVDMETFFNVDIEDEIENEELQTFDEPSLNDNGENLLDGMKNESSIVEDEIWNENTFFQEFDESHAENLKNKSARTLKSTTNKVKKIPVAPGEDGKFQNWGEDTYLEEKAFPELFPFGDGGYLSSLLNSKEQDMGFAMYVKHRILSYDSKFRKNSTYLFFLLLVKELVQLKRCKQTYMRQATKLPNLSKETVKNVKLQDLSRYNRSYEVFKTMRGTSMYYEDAKKNVMAILRQNGSPSLF